MLVAGARVELPLGGGERVGSGGRRAREPVERGREPLAPGAKLRGGLGDGGDGGGDDLELRRGHLELEAAVAVEPRQGHRRHRRQVEGLGVEQHQLLLEPDRQRLGRLEGRPQRRGVGRWLAHGSGRLRRGRCRWMRLLTAPGVFAPRSDSWLLAEHARRRVRAGATVLDPFTGSGVLAIAAAAGGAGEVTAIDISRRAVACAWLNARLNGVAVQARRGDMFSPVAGRRFDLIVANPPYLPTIDERDPSGAARAWDAGRDGRALLDRLCDRAAEHLEPGGELLLVHSSVCDPGATTTTLADTGLEVEVLAREHGRLGRLLAERAWALEARGLVSPGDRTEEIIVFSARRPRRVHGRSASIGVARQALHRPPSPDRGPVGIPSVARLLFAYPGTPVTSAPSQSGGSNDSLSRADPNSSSAVIKPSNGSR